MLIGYARVSAADQNPDHQFGMLSVLAARVVDVDVRTRPTPLRRR
jgi:hypothetical protein